MLSPVANQSNVKWLYGCLIAFGAIAIFSVVNEFYWTLLFPLALVVIISGMYRLDMMMFFTVLLTPLSINLAKTNLGIGVSLPSEPLIFGLMLLFLARIAYDKGMDKKILYHPVSIAIILHLIWFFVTTVTSSMPLVSFKASIARFCFVVVFFYLGTQAFRNIKNVNTFAWLYIIPLLIVIAYTTINHAMAGFTEKAAHTSMVPFYNDHTAYAAVIAMFIPLLFGYVGDKTASRAGRLAAFAILAIFITAIVLSYTRASWLSLVAAFICYLIFFFRIHTSIVLIGIASVIVIFLSFQTQITMSLEQNEEQSSTDYASHVQSMSNISSDASNVERLNRWNSAFRMHANRPWFGWGPGTYMFQYAPYQKWSEKTIISTNFGEGGNAHSEYIGPLAEQGYVGPVLFILIGVFVIYRASRMLMQTRDHRLRMLIKGLLLGLITYWVHGMLNNFLDTEKASVPFWGFIAALTALEVYHLKERETKNSRALNS
jgi:putative inorganic carbon (hco3(-)) transporter